jgi:hypothetical protein
MTVVVGHHSPTALGGPQKDGAVAAALLLGHLETGACPRPAETIEDRPLRASGARQRRRDGPRPDESGRGESQGPRCRCMARRAGPPLEPRAP